MRVPSRLMVAAAFCSLAIAGCQGSAPQPDSLPTPPSGGTARLTVLNGAYSVEVVAGPVTQSEALLASSRRSPTSYSIVATPEGAYSLRFSRPGGGSQSWTVRLSRKLG